MNTDKLDRRDELETLLPFYLNGTLSEDEREAVERWLASDPAAAIALEEAEAEYSAAAMGNEAIRPPADALSRLSAALERESGPPRLARTTWLKRAGGWFAAPSSGLAWGTAALAVALLAAQTAWISTRDADDYSVAGTSEERVQLPFLLVSFDDEALLSEVTGVLQSLRLEIDAGPLPGGVYRVILPVSTATDYDRLAAELEAQPLVARVIAGARPEAE